MNLKIYIILKSDNELTIAHGIYNVKILDPVSERIGNKILHGQHLPDSRPNTESGGNSSASPSSSGCCTVNPGTVNPREAGQNSPYTPPSADFIQPHHHGSHQHLQQQLQKTGDFCYLNEFKSIKK